MSPVLGAIAFYRLLLLRFPGADTPMRSLGGRAGHYMSLSLQPNALTPFLFGVIVAIIFALVELLPLWIYSFFPAVLQLAGRGKASAVWHAGTSGVSPTSLVQQWAYSTDPATGASIVADPATDVAFSIGPTAGQWVEITPAPQAPVPGPGGVAAGATAAGGLSESVPTNTVSHKKIILGLSAFGVVVAPVATGIVGLDIVNGMHGPEKVIGGYLTFLSERKVSEAIKIVGPGALNDRRKLPTDDTLKTAKTRTGVIKINKLIISGDTAAIKTHLSLDGEIFEYNFIALRSPGPFGLGSWKVDKLFVVFADFSSSSLPGLKVTEVATDLAEEEDGRSGSRISTQFAYPGVYPASTPDSVSRYFSVKEIPFTPIPSGRGATSKAESVGTRKVDTTPTDELKTKMLEKVKEQTKICVAASTNLDKTYPYQTSPDMTLLSVGKDVTKMEFSGDSNDLSFIPDEIGISGSPKPTASGRNPSPHKTKFTFSGRVGPLEGGGGSIIMIGSSSSVF